MADLLKLAEDMKFSKKFEKVSLGQGQGPKAERQLEFGMDRGVWVCLQVSGLQELHGSNIVFVLFFYVLHFTGVHAGRAQLYLT